MGLRKFATAGIVGAAVTAACLATAPAASAGPSNAVAATTTAGLGAVLDWGWGQRGGAKVVGLAGDGTKLVRFGLDRPGRIVDHRPIIGLAGDTRLVGIDHRVQNGKLYGVGDQGGVYTIDGAAVTKVSQLTVALTGTAFDIDFNPAADRLRVLSDTGQNLRHDVVGGTTTADTTLNYPTPPNPAPPATGISAGAYTNNDVDPSTGTSLFDIDSTNDQVALQSPANSGQLALTGKLGVDAGTGAGFDIVSTRVDGRTKTNVGYATLSVDGAYGLYRVSPLTGEAVKIGNFPAPRQVIDIALKLK